MRENQWGYWHPYLPFLGDEVTGKTIGILGTGRIGQAVIKKCIGFDMNILCYEALGPNEKLVADVQQQMDLRFKSGMQRERTSIKYVSIEEALSQSDFVSIHVPLLREGESDTPTYHLINERTLRRMKPTAYLVNTSRGPVIDEKALAKALKEKWIAGAALDVYEKEPLPPDSPLRDPEIEDRCRLYPHFASAARITRLIARSQSRHGRAMRAGADRRAGAKLRRRYRQDAVCGEQGSVPIRKPLAISSWCLVAEGCAFLRVRRDVDPAQVEPIAKASFLRCLLETDSAFEVAHGGHYSVAVERQLDGGQQSNPAGASGYNCNFFFSHGFPPNPSNCRTGRKRVRSRTFNCNVYGAYEKIASLYILS